MPNNSKKIITASPARGKSSPKATYDVVDGKNSKQRRKAKLEVKGEDYQLDGFKRPQMLSLGRDVVRNYTTAKAHENQFRVNVVGVGPKIHINIDDPACKEASDWFNGVYMKNCDARDDTPYNENCMNLLTCAKREGDSVVAFDNFYNNDGKLFFWEADQLAEIDKKEWKKLAAEKGWKAPGKDGEIYSQSQGVVYDKMGVVKAYIVCEDRKPGAKKFKDVTILPREETAKLMKTPWRFNQRRGVPGISAALAHYLDSYEMQSAELQSGKLNAKLAGKVKRRDDLDDDLLLENDIDPDDYTGTTTSDGTETNQTGAPLNTNYTKFENLCGGLVEYMDDIDDFELLDNKRPNVNVKDYLETININNGASLGLSKVYSTLTASTSYTAFRGEMLLAWAQFIVDQKWLERRFVDWNAIKALNWAMSKRLISKLPEGWENKISVTWPEMPVVDPLKLQLAIAKALKNGVTDFSKLLGPNWKSHLTAFAEQVDIIRELSLPLDLLETKSGGTPAGEQATDNAAKAIWNNVKGLFKHEK